MSAVIVGILLIVVSVPLAVWFGVDVGRSVMAAGFAVMSFGYGWLLAGRRK